MYTSSPDNHIGMIIFSWHLPMEDFVYLKISLESIIAHFLEPSTVIFLKGDKSLKLQAFPT